MISIIIPVHNQHLMTEQCLESIRVNTRDYELIVIDNGSDPVFESADVWYPTNVGFPAAVNMGIRAATGDIICLLNNDTVVTPGWAEKLSAHLDEYSIVGPMTNYVAGLQRAQTAAYDDDQSLNHAAEEWARDHTGDVQEVNFVIGFCMMFKKSLFDELGDFDESMWPCSGEEIDFSLRARAAGHRVGIVKEVYIHHYGSATFKDMQQAGQLNYETVCRECDAHLAEKWGSDFWQKQGQIKRKNDKNIRLNLGCGAYKLPGFLNIDQNPDVNPYLVCDALDLPFDPGTVDEIYCGHMLEHLTLEEGEKALKYWIGLLDTGGKITVIVPDFNYLVTQYISNPSAYKLRKLNDEIIYSYCQKSHHKYCYSGDLLKEIMAKVGFVSLEKLPFEHPYFTDAVEWQVGYEGRKA